MKKNPTFGLFLFSVFFGRLPDLVDKLAFNPLYIVVRSFVSRKKNESFLCLYVRTFGTENLKTG